MWFTALICNVIILTCTCYVFFKTLHCFSVIKLRVSSFRITAFVRNERPLSASRKNKPQSSLQLDNNVDEVLKALKQENSKIGEEGTNIFTP